MKGHYLLLVISVGKTDFRREYLPLSSEDETVEEATDRWLDMQVEGRKRNVQKARNYARESIQRRQLCRPSAWWADQPAVKFNRRGRGR